jgi:hypothetical protein
MRGSIFSRRPRSGDPQVGADAEKDEVPLSQLFFLNLSFRALLKTSDTLIHLSSNFLFALLDPGGEFFL